MIERVGRFQCHQIVFLKAVLTLSSCSCSDGEAGTEEIQLSCPFPVVVSKDDQHGVDCTTMTSPLPQIYQLYEEGFSKEVTLSCTKL